MAASSTDINEKAMQYYLYPPPITQYEDVIASAKLFMDSLGKFHAAMGTKFKIPIIGGKDLDLHRLFMEVTSRGGIKRVLEEKKWREVTNCFCFPPSATNASFILRKYYMSLIHHFEQVYYFKAKAWTPVPTDTWQSTKTTLTSTSEMNKAVFPFPNTQISPSMEAQVGSVKRQRMTTEEDMLPIAAPESSIGLPVTGVIDGKFESGYLCTVRIGGEQLQGVLYQIERNPYELLQVGSTDATPMVKRRRRRRKKSEMRKRDPAHPKPNRSGYNFFFAEHHAQLKLLHTGKDRCISRMIGEHWNKLTEAEKAVYQEKAVKDKERYRIEMEHYRGGFPRGQPIDNVVTLEQPYFTNPILVENNENSSENSHQNEQNSGYFDDDTSSFEEEEEITEKQLNLGIPSAAKEVKIETEDHQSLFLDGSVQQKSMSLQMIQPLVAENESAHIQEEESKQDEKSPDVNDEKKTKSSENQDKILANDVENFEKDPQVIQETTHVVENTSFSTEEKGTKDGQ